MEMLKSDERMYKWIWLGISIGLDEIIYYMFDKESHILNRDLTDNEKNKIDRIDAAVDYWSIKCNSFRIFWFGSY